jgi:hypothetical protein
MSILVDLENGPVDSLIGTFSILVPTVDKDEKPAKIPFDRH